MLTRLFVLGLLAARPMSGYAIQRLLQLSQTEQWAGVLPGSIYHALKKLAAEGMVTLQTTEQTGNRARAIYAITPDGVAKFHELLRTAWGQPELHFPGSLYAAMTFLDALPREEVMAAIAAHIGALEAELAAWNAGETAKIAALPPDLPEELARFTQLAFVNGREHIEGDLRLLHTLYELLPSLPVAPRLPDSLPTLEEDEL